MGSNNISLWLSTVTAMESVPQTTLVERSGDAEKLLAMVVLGLGSFLSGMLPAVISEHNRRRFPLITSLLLCFGAGILLATALVHILPEVREQMTSNFAEISLCVGFFIIYFIDEFIHYFFGEAVRHAHSHSAPSLNISATTTPVVATLPSSTTQNAVQNTSRCYGTLTEAAPLLRAENNNTFNHQHVNITPAPAVNTIIAANSTTISNAPTANDSHEHVHAKVSSSHEHVATLVHEHIQGSGHGHSHAIPCDDDAIVDAANAVMCHTSHTEPCVTQSITGTLGLFVALSLHSAIEGLAIGVQNSSTKVLFLLGAVACHKFVMGFCLGLEFCSNSQTRLRAQLIGISVFALGAVCGIGIGMLIVDVPAGWVSAALPVIQSLAGGTLLYVTVCEVMPREKARWHQNVIRRSAGFLQFMAVLCGFTAMSLINHFFSEEHT